MLTSTEETPGFRKIKGQTIAMHGVSSIEAFIPKISLLRNPEFHLIHVLQEDDGERRSMTVVTPGLHRPTRKQVVEQGYYTISHLWGPEEEWKPWTDHGIIGTGGQPVKVNIRPEKKDGLLRLLSTVQGFWWIDVFCAQSKTPPSIMGAVYRFCNRCYSLVDFPSNGFSRIEAISMHLESVESIKDLAEPCRNRINGRTVSENQSWHESLDDILGGWYDGDSTDIKVLADFFSCQWFARVWTLQEYLLPSKLIFISEDDPANYCLDRSIIASITMNLRTLASYVLESVAPILSDNRLDSYFFLLRREQYEEISTTPGATRCYFDLTRFIAIELYMICTADPDEVDYYGEVLWLWALQVFARLPRRSMYTRDYIYGVAGILDMNISLADNDEDVWASFRKIAQEKLPFLEIPEKSPLTDAKDMQDVYGPALESIRAFMWGPMKKVDYYGDNKKHITDRCVLS